MTAKIIQFPQTADPLDFAGMGIKIDVEKQRESWAAVFTAVQTALRFCNFDHVEVEETVRKFNEEDGFIDETVSCWSEAIDYLEAAVEAMNAACARLAISQERVAASSKIGTHMTTKPKAIDPAKGEQSGYNSGSLMEQYNAIKAENPGFLLFYRMGQFYELFFEDAEIAAEALGIVLTKRGKHEGRDIPMCGVPVGRHEDYLNRLVCQGHRVATCEQIDEPLGAFERGEECTLRRVVARIAGPPGTFDP